MTQLVRCVVFLLQADFFWECNGEAKGGHTGFVENWIRNCKFKPKSAKRSRRHVPISEEQLRAYEELCATDSTPESRPRIMQLLAETFTCRQSMRTSNGLVSEMVSEYPCLLDEEAVHIYVNVL